MQKEVTLSSIFNSKLDTLLLVFFNINIEESGNLQVEGSFKKSKYAKINYNENKDKLYKNFSNNISSYYNLQFEYTKSKIKCSIINDLNLSYDDIISKLRNLIIYNLSQVDINVIDKKIALASLVLRGSPDIKGNFFSLDIKKENETDLYLKSLFSILSSSNELLNHLNWNFRDLQNDYVTGKNKRNSQFRINLRWCYENILKELKELHYYKYDIINSSKSDLGNLPKNHNNFETFIKRINFYREKILGVNLSETEINKIRNDLFGETNTLPTRSRRLVEIIKNTTTDECSACKYIYNISDRSFVTRKDGRYYFEYHHFISYANDKENLDVLENLVKLCPVCHRALTPGRAEEEYQKEIIKNILIDRKDIFEFSELYFKSGNLDDLINSVYLKLR